MSLALENKNIQLEFHNSEEGYQGARFAQLGKLVSVKFESILYTTNELKSGFSNQHGTGFYNEFDIDNALGYDETEKGDWFHKIGVGLLKKDDEVYDFFKEYEYIKPALEVESDEEFISFRAIQKEYNGYGYELRQTYRLKEC